MRRKIPGGFFSAMAPHEGDLTPHDRPPIMPLWPKVFRNGVRSLPHALGRLITRTTFSP